MKKALALLLALVMCLSLAACGVDEKYTALLENLDSNNYDGIKQELSALSPDFAAEQEKMKADTETLAKYADLIAMLEKEEYGNALANITARMPVPEEPEYVEVEITMDNWEQYFELREATHVSENIFGEVENIWFGYGVFLRPEYAERVENPHDVMDVNFKYTMTDDDTLFYFVELDKENFTYEVIKRTYSTSTGAGMEGVIQVWYFAPDECSEKSDFYGAYAAEMGFSPWERDDGCVLYIADNFQIVNATGSLKLHS